MPAGLLPPRREKLFPDVSARYLDTVHREKPNYVPPARTTYETQRAWSHTPSRWASDAKEKPASPRAAPDVNDPLAAWNEAVEHRNLARRSIGNVPSRFLEDAEHKGHPEHSPRERITKKDESSKLEKNWRGTHALNKHTTFDVLYQRWLKKHRDEKFMQRKKNSARSPVGDYVRHGTPIESTSRGATPQRGRSAPAAAASPGRIGNIGDLSASQIRRTQSPWERTVSPDRWKGDRWKGAGVALNSFDRYLQKPVQRQIALQEEHAREVVEHIHDKKVDKSFVPRVAKLALIYQIPESARSLSRKEDSGSFGPMYAVGGGGGSRSPTRSPRGDSPSRRLH